MKNAANASVGNVAAKVKSAKSKAGKLFQPQVAGANLQSVVEEFEGPDYGLEDLSWVKDNLGFQPARFD